MAETDPYQSPQTNPYQSPQHVEPAIRLTEADLWKPAVSIWRDGNVLVMHKSAVLPDRCVKSNQPAHGRRLRRSLSWHNPMIYLTLLIHLLLYIILAMVLRKSAVIEIGLSEEWFRRRRRAIIIGWSTVLVSVCLFVLGVALIGEFEAAALLIAAGPIVFLVGAIYGLVAARMVAAKRITKQHVWLKGVHRDFLAEFPHWPGD